MNFISVIIPTYKRSKRLTKAIDSVLNQSYSNIEIIVVDDNGDNHFREETREVLRPYIEDNKIKYICHDTNKGGCIARNTGAFAAKAKYISFLDDDDFYEPSKIEEQLSFMDKHQALDACMCCMFRVDENNLKIESRENIARGETLKEVILDGNLFTSMLLIKREVFLNLGGFSDIPRFQDKYFHYKLLNAGFKIGVLSKQLLTLVEHQENRISSISVNKVVISLKKIHEFEKQNKKIFSKKEWKRIKLDYLYAKALIRTQGSLAARCKSLANTVQAIPFAISYLDLLKLLLKAMLPHSSNKLKK